ncbi:MAG: type II/IV secretion system protein [Nitrospirae bacterium]|nr:type II/IV secretion system protein [Nitrospirota bacterium]
MATLRLGELLISKGFLTWEQLHVAMSQQAVTGVLLGETLIRLGFVSSKEVAQTLSEQSGIEFINVHDQAPTEEALKLVSREIAERTGFIPLDVKNGILSIGITNPSNILAIDTATRIGGRPPKVFMVDSEGFYDTMERAYYFLEHPLQKRIDAAVAEIRTAQTTSAGMISSLTELLIMDGIRKNATDIHINPAAESIHVFYRIDGVLQHGHCFPRSALSGIVSRIKILSNMDIAEQRLPQDGSFSFAFLKKQYDMRVSTIPTIYGENVVTRILGGSTALLRIANLGFDSENTRQMRLLFSKPYGIILITGPTGSGKTTTLYAALREINILEKNVLTVEDPVEYKLSMIRQTEVNEKAGYDFALAGRNFMRQDPDVMLLGEIRDEETAKIAIRSSITGHLVLTTLHTNDAVTAIPRIIDLNVDRYLLSSSLLAVVAQRLVRKICAGCKTEYSLGTEEARDLGIFEPGEAVSTAYRGEGCSLCNNTGYLGRIAIGEILIVEDEIRELINTGASVKAMRDMAVKKGMKTLREDGLKKAAAGITTFSEVLRVAG